jgi:CubicO group peptidase (beta-lactamase class C family)
VHAMAAGPTRLGPPSAEPSVRPQLVQRALSGPGNVFARGRTWNDPAVWAAELPAANGIFTAGALSRLYAALLGRLDGRRCPVPDSVLKASKPAVAGVDCLLRVEKRFGLGFQCASTSDCFGSSVGFGHTGAGGSVGFADPLNRVAFAYLTNRARPGFGTDPRARALITAVYAARRAVKRVSPC